MKFYFLSGQIQNYRGLFLSKTGGLTTRNIPYLQNIDTLKCVFYVYICFFLLYLFSTKQKLCIYLM